MGGPSVNRLASQLGRLFDRGTVTGLSESQLLDAFVNRKDEAAFEAIVNRHGPMVLKVCRQLLRNPADVEDAFQATFVVLVLRASTLKRKELLANWLYGVAYKVASRSRSIGIRNGGGLSSAVDVAELGGSSVGETSLDFDTVGQVHDALTELPDRYRKPIVLCYLEGLTHEEAATQLGWPLGSVKGRLARGRDLLRNRLVRRGISLSTLATVVNLESQVRACAVPELLRNQAIRSALASSSESAKGIVTSSALSATVSSLAQGVIRTMFVSQIRAIAIPAVLGVGILSTGASVVAFQFGDMAQNAKESKPASVKAPATGGDKPQQAGQKPQAGPQGQLGQQGNAASHDQQRLGRYDDAMMGGGGFGGGRQVQIEEQRQARIRAADSKQRQDNATLAALILEADKSPKTKELLQKLEEPITLDFGNETPLQDVLKYIESVTKGKGSIGIPIYVDPQGLVETEKTLGSPVTIKLEGIPLKTTLRLVLKQLGLAYCVHDGFLMISSPNGIREELEEVRAALGLPVPESISPGGFIGGSRGVMGGRGLQ